LQFFTKPVIIQQPATFLGRHAAYERFAAIPTIGRVVINRGRIAALLLGPPWHMGWGTRLRHDQVRMAHGKVNVTTLVERVRVFAAKMRLRGPTGAASIPGRGGNVVKPAHDCLNPRIKPNAQSVHPGDI